MVIRHLLMNIIIIKTIYYNRGGLMSVFKGSGVALITPFKLDSKGNSVVDYDTLYKLLDFHLENGTDAIIVCGTTGEASTMTKKEHIEIIKKCVNYVNGRLPIIAGTGSNNTNTAVKLSQVTFSLADITETDKNNVKRIIKLNIILFFMYSHPFNKLYFSSI